MAIYKIKNGELEILVNQAGAELCGIKSVKTGKDYMWNGSPDVWPEFSPVLFPIIGFLRDGEFLYNEKKYCLMNHGFVVGNDNVKLVFTSPTQLSFSLVHDEETKKMYPFEFEFIIKYVLEGDKIIIGHEIINHGSEEMLFSVGGHPGFKCPFNTGETYEDYYLEFEKPETALSLRLNTDGLLTDTTIPVIENDRFINLNYSLFDDDALIFEKLNSNKISLKSKKSSGSIDVEFPGFSHLGIWAKLAADYVCIEPWLGIADKFNSDKIFTNKEGLVKLGSKQNYSISYSIKINEAE